MKRVDVGESEPMIVVDDVNGLLEMVQAGIVEIHPWGSRYENLEKPDRLIFDLDPGEGVRWSDMIDAARETRDFLAELGLQSFVKTTGGKGLHVVVPVEPTMEWEPAKAFTQSVAETLARKRPDRYVAVMSKTFAARAHLHRLSAQRTRRDRGRRLFDARAAPRIRLDAARVGRAFRRPALGPLHAQQYPGIASSISKTIRGRASSRSVSASRRRSS